jgi:hypothetical protein
MLEETEPQSGMRILINKWHSLARDELDKGDFCWKKNFSIDYYNNRYP